MSELPKPLRPWGPQLSVLVRDLAVTLGPWLQRLSAAVGPFASSDQASGGAPDGYDGVTLRGSYERLLSTEWLLAEEAPDEFLRRAAAREHQFHRLANREPKAQRASLLVFDAGPDQLGTPRIAHLALLMVLAARAEASQSKLVWGTLQGGVALRHEGFTQDLAELLLKARSGFQPTDAQATAWHELPHDELWLVGSRTTSSIASSITCSRISIHDDTNPGARRLEVTVTRPGRAKSQLELPVPEASTSTRLLRDPFVRAPPPAPKTKPVEADIDSLVLANTGSHLFMRDRKGNFIALTYPGAVMRKTMRAVVVPPRDGEHFIAAGWSPGIGMLLLSVEVDSSKRPMTLVLRYISKRGAHSRSASRYRVPDRFDWDESDPLTTVAPIGRPSVRLVVPMKRGTLQFDQLATFTKVDVAAWIDTPESLKMLVHDANGRRFLVSETARDNVAPTALDGLGEILGLFGYGATYAWFPGEDTARWHLPSGRLINLDAEFTPVAATDKGLIALGPNRRELIAFEAMTGMPWSPSTRRTLFISTHPIQQVAFIADQVRLAVLDITGNISILEWSTWGMPGSYVSTATRMEGFKWNVQRNVQARIEVAARNRDFIQAIKLYRESSTAGLADAKTAVEELAAELERTL